jgi:hypothetical protein
MRAVTIDLSASVVLGLMAAFCLFRWNKIRKQAVKKDTLDRLDRADRREFDWYATYHDRS